MNFDQRLCINPEQIQSISNRLISRDLSEQETNAIIGNYRQIVNHAVKSGLGVTPREKFIEAKIKQLAATEILVQQFEAARQIFDILSDGGTFYTIDPKKLQKSLRTPRTRQRKYGNDRNKRDIQAHVIPEILQRMQYLSTEFGLEPISGKPCQYEFPNHSGTGTIQNVRKDANLLVSDSHQSTFLYPYHVRSLST